MRMVDLIVKKRDGGILSNDELEHLVKGFSNDDIPDYQISAFLMAVFFKGLNPDELFALTRAMIKSGDVFDLSDVPGAKVDKHSTGGVGDKVSLILAPAVAACGVVVPMISGRALGHTGGTLDKLESIPGYQTTIGNHNYKKQLREIGLAIVGQSIDLVPADKKLYALRDVTGTIESIPLIAASIMSKKIASGTRALVLDVKTGNGAFMDDMNEAVELAKTLVEVGYGLECPTTALITDMNQPLGRAVGNSLEVIECIETMKGEGAPDLVEITEILGAHMLILGNVTDTLDDARKKVHNALTGGEALEKFRRMIEYQRGNPRVVDDISLFDIAETVEPFKATQAGYITRIDTQKIGLVSMLLGAGRNRIEEPVDHGVGVVFHKKLADYVEKDEPICDIYYRTTEKRDEARDLLAGAFEIRSDNVSPPALVKAIINRKGTEILKDNG